MVLECCCQSSFALPFQQLTINSKHLTPDPRRSLKHPKSWIWKFTSLPIEHFEWNQHLWGCPFMCKQHFTVRYIKSTSLRSRVLAKSRFHQIFEGYSYSASHANSFLNMWSKSSNSGVTFSDVTEITWESQRCHRNHQKWMLFNGKEVREGLATQYLYPYNTGKRGWFLYFFSIFFPFFYITILF